MKRITRKARIRVIRSNSCYFYAMEVDYLIVGQGVSGSWLSYYLLKEGSSFIVIDNNDINAPSRLTAGIVNPVTGRRYATAWMAGEILPFAWDAYHEIGSLLEIKAISHRSILDFFPSPQMRLSFLERLEEKNIYVHSYADQNQFNPFLNYDFGCGEIRPAYTAHLELLLPAWRELLRSNNQLLEEDFDLSKLKIDVDKIFYEDIIASKIIFCDGPGGANNPYFKLLPFAPNKGEMMLLEIPDLSPEHIYKKGMMLVPLATPGQWWIGSSYEWDFKDAAPSPEFRKKTEQVLKDWLKVPFKIFDHFAGLRPATLERRPFVGIHPHHPAIGILNGMGTKGCSLAPYFARQLTDHLLFNKPIHPEANVNRFQKILAKS